MHWSMRRPCPRPPKLASGCMGDGPCAGTCPAAPRSALSVSSALGIRFKPWPSLHQLRGLEKVVNALKSPSLSLCTCKTRARSPLGGASTRVPARHRDRGHTLSSCAWPSRSSALQCSCPQAKMRILYFLVRLQETTGFSIFHPTSDQRSMWLPHQQQQDEGFSFSSFAFFFFF